MQMLDTIDIVRLARCSRALYQAACHHSAFDYARKMYALHEGASGLSLFLPWVAWDLGQPLSPSMRGFTMRGFSVRKLTHTYSRVRTLWLYCLAKCSTMPEPSRVALAFPRLSRLTVDSCRDQDWTLLTHLREMTMIIYGNESHVGKIYHAPQLARLTISAHHIGNALDLSKLVAPQVRHLVLKQSLYTPSFQGIDVETLEMTLHPRNFKSYPNWSTLVAMLSLRYLILHTHIENAEPFLARTSVLRDTVHARQGGYIRLIFEHCVSCDMSVCHNLVLHGLVVGICCKERAQTWSSPPLVPQTRTRTWLQAAVQLIAISILALRHMAHSAFRG
jgi:hypothetical protein